MRTSRELGVTSGIQELKMHVGESLVIKTTEMDYITQRVCRMRRVETKILGQALKEEYLIDT